MRINNIQLNIRIKRIEFKNFRNIESGAIDFPNASAKDYYIGNSSMLGLYGQNGSGKSSVIMALGILKDILSGKKIGEKYSSCIRSGCDRCTLSFSFSVFGIMSDSDNEKAEVFEYFYDFDIKKQKTMSINDYGESVDSTKYTIENEIFKVRQTDSCGNVISPKRVLFDTRKSASDDKDMIFGCNIYTYVALTDGDEKEIVEQYKEAKIISRENGTSFIFSNKFLEIPLMPYDSLGLDSNTEFKKFTDIFLGTFNKYVGKKIDEDELDLLEKKFLDSIKNDFPEEKLECYFSAIFKISALSPILSLKDYGHDYLQVVDTITTGITNINTRLPLLLWKRRESETDDIFIYKCYLLMDKPTSVPEELYGESIKALKAISDVLNKIVPEMSLDFTDLGKRLSQDNKEEHCFEILSKRNNQRIPLKYESDGIRRMVSILSLLIAVYNEESFTVAIDEIDSGIFEYLLGEILSVMSESIKGQFVFTSHNLRPLEVLPAKYLCFTTTNPENRFTTLPHRGNSNMRDTYFRNIILGSNKGKEPIYKATDKFEIERAFYKAGHPEDGEL